VSSGRIDIFRVTVRNRIFENITVKKNIVYSFSRNFSQSRSHELVMTTPQPPPPTSLIITVYFFSLLIFFFAIIISGAGRIRNWPFVLLFYIYIYIYTYTRACNDPFFPPVFPRYNNIVPISTRLYLFIPVCSSLYITRSHTNIHTHTHTCMYSFVHRILHAQL
jgi:hypothetical protein